MSHTKGAVEPPLVVIVGPTASGKTGAAIKLAQQIDGEIICADSRTIYRDMNIGTAKPTDEEQQGIPHWGIDIATPGQVFTVANFKQYADTAIDAIRARGRVPIMVGGTGLYIDAVLYDYSFSLRGDEAKRHLFSAYTVKELQEYCKNNDISLPENLKNKRHLIRAIERNGENHKRNTRIRDNTIVVGIASDKDLLRAKMRQRIEQMVSQNVVQEAMILGKKYGWYSEAMTGNIYRYIRDKLECGHRTLTAQDIDALVVGDWRLAKRQLTWFRRNQAVIWLPAEEVVSYICSWLAQRIKK